MKHFTSSIIAAALLCGAVPSFAQEDEVRVTPAIDEDTFEPSFQFSENDHYFTIFLDEETQAANLADDQVTYIGANPDEGRNLWIWAGTSTFLDPSGTNSFSVPGNYMSYRVGTDGWSGLGYNIDATHPVDLSAINDDYTFHLALMSTSKETVEFYLTDLDGHEANLVFGKTAYDGKEPIADFNRDGEWYNIDIPMTYLEDNFGFSLKNAKEYKDKNILCVLAGAVEGTVINYDAVFFYGPKTPSGVNGVFNADSNAPKEFYSADGTKVSSSYADSHKGIYVVKQGNTTKKIAR